MKKIVLGFICLSLSISVLCNYCFALPTEDVKSFNGAVVNRKKPIQFKKTLLEYQDSVYVPIREFCDNMSIPISWDCEKELITINAKEGDNILTTEKNLIDSKELAYNVGKSILENYCKKSLEYVDNGFEYYLYVSEGSDIWIIRQYVTYNQTHFYAGNYISPYIIINKKDGKILEIDDNDTDIKELVENYPKHKDN